MDYGIAGARVLVTGASRGIGRAVAQALAREGASVALGARDADALASTVELIRAGGGSAEAVPMDLARPQDAPRIMDDVRAKLRGDPLIAVISHAHLSPMTKIHALSAEVAREAIATDLESTMALLRAAVPAMMAARFGRIVFISSGSAQLGQGKAPLYCALKAALEGLARNLAIDFTKFGVTSNVVAPGFIDTERLRARVNEAQRQRLRGATSARELGQPEQVAEVVAFLCSRAAAYVSGAVVPVTGGAHLANLW